MATPILEVLVKVGGPVLEKVLIEVLEAEGDKKTIASWSEALDWIDPQGKTATLRTIRSSLSRKILEWAEGVPKLGWEINNARCLAESGQIDSALTRLRAVRSLTAGLQLEGHSRIAAAAIHNEFVLEVVSGLWSDDEPLHERLDAAGIKLERIDAQQQATIRTTISILHQISGATTIALEEAEKAELMLRAAGSTSAMERVRASLNLSSALDRVGRELEALELTRETLAVAQDYYDSSPVDGIILLGEVLQQYSSQLILRAVRTDTGRRGAALSEAIKITEWAVALTSRVPPDLELLARVPYWFENHARTLRLLGAPDEAKRYIDKARKLLAKYQSDYAFVDFDIRSTIGDLLQIAEDGFKTSERCEIESSSSEMALELARDSLELLLPVFQHDPTRHLPAVLLATQFLGRHPSSLDSNLPRDFAEAIFNGLQKGVEMIVASPLFSELQ